MDSSPDITQRSESWFNARLGKVTASRIADVCAKTKTGWGASRKNYMAELIVERLTGKRTEGFTNAAMQWGTDQEPEARAAYEWYCDARVTDAGFIIHPTLTDSGASPDGFVGESGLVEFKCPNTATHLETLDSGIVDQKYVLQMQWQMACAQRDWCDFVSFDPRLPESMSLFVQRVERDDKLLSEITETVAGFLAELAATVERLRAKYEQKEAA